MRVVRDRAGKGGGVSRERGGKLGCGVSELYQVAALFVDPRGPYPGMVADWWDEQRDARKYAGPLPVVAHPPCGAYGSLRHMAVPNRERRANEAACGPIAFEHVRRYGGVLEQPKGSLLFALCGAPKPGELPDDFGGVTIEVEQVRFGHVARKRTWLYLVGVRDTGLNPPPRDPTHWVSGGRLHTRKGSGGVVPPGIKVCSAQQRRRTPPAFARWLCELAQSARQPSAEGLVDHA